jgi:hypothetical protein
MVLPSASNTTPQFHACIFIDRSLSDPLGEIKGIISRYPAPRDCYEAGRTFAFIAVILDCVDNTAKAFCQRYDFQELPGQPYRLFLSAQQLEAMMEGENRS